MKRVSFFIKVEDKLREVRLTCDESACDICRFKFCCLSDVEPVEIETPFMLNDLSSIPKEIEKFMFGDRKNRTHIQVVWERKE